MGQLWTGCLHYHYLHIGQYYLGWINTSWSSLIDSHLQSNVWFLDHKRNELNQVTDTTLGTAWTNWPACSSASARLMPCYNQASGNVSPCPRYCAAAPMGLLGSEPTMEVAQCWVAWGCLGNAAWVRLAPPVPHLPQVCPTPAWNVSFLPRHHLSIFNHALVEIG